LTLGKACFFSVALHAALLLSYVYSAARIEIGGLASAPASDLHARIFSYQRIKPAKTAAHQDSRSPATLAGDGEQNKSAVPQASAVAVDVQEEKILEQGALDASPVILSNVILEYPAAANNREGLVSLEIVILGTGAVESVKVLKAVPPGFFEEAAITGFKNAKFSPGLLGGLGVKSRMEVEVEFMPTNRGGSVSGQR